MSTISGRTVDINCLLATLVFVGHIVGNIWVSAPSSGPSLPIQKLSLFPPAWVFSIWLVIWGLQSVLLVQSYRSGFWTGPVTGLFMLMCLGNVGSQWAGANNTSWTIYIACLFCMVVASVLFMKRGEQSPVSVPVLKAAGQLYVGWATIALVVGVGIILVVQKQVVSDSTYSLGGLLLLVTVPVVIWLLRSRGIADYRLVSLPYFLVLTALGIRIANAGRQFLSPSP